MTRDIFCRVGAVPRRTIPFFPGVSRSGDAALRPACCGTARRARALYEAARKELHGSLVRCSSSAVIYGYAAREVAVLSDQSAIGMDELPTGMLRLGNTYSRRFWTENCVLPTPVTPARV